MDSSIDDETTGHPTGDAPGRAPRDGGRLTVQAETQPSDTTRGRSVIDAAVRLVRAVREAAGRPSVRPWLIGATALAFVALSVGSFRALPDDGRSAKPALVAVLVLVTTPATLALNGLEYRFMGRTLGHRIGFRHAMRISLVASIANYLPAPGGVAVRTAALKRRGSTVRSAVSINAVAGLVWA
ncbi:MAG: lysylphosphatidylglycerol synthase domain-containing protein, partial [Acidimicrobiales bacterium]